MMIDANAYGSGYSNEIRIPAIDPDIVRIDITSGAFCADGDRQQLVRNPVSFCPLRGIRLAAEGGDVA